MSRLQAETKSVDKQYLDFNDNAVSAYTIPAVTQKCDDAEIELAVEAAVNALSGAPYERPNAKKVRAEMKRYLKTYTSRIKSEWVRLGGEISQQDQPRFRQLLREFGLSEEKPQTLENPSGESN